MLASMRIIGFIIFVLKVKLKTLTKTLSDQDLARCLVNIVYWQTATANLISKLIERFRLIGKIKDIKFLRLFEQVLAEENIKSPF